MENLFGKRILALIIDALAITLILWIFSALIYPLIVLAGFFGVLNYWFILAALLILGYFTYLEFHYSQTLGKNIMKIRVITDKGEMTTKKAFIRNLSKTLWLPLIVDIIIGYFDGSSKIRYLDKVAGTDVIDLNMEEGKEIKSSSEPNSVLNK